MTPPPQMITFSINPFRTATFVSFGKFEPQLTSKVIRPTTRTALRNFRQKQTHMKRHPYGC